MPNAMVVLKNEISRLARKEAKKYAAPLNARVSAISRNVVQKRRQITALEKRVARLEKLATSSPAVSVSVPPAELDKARVSPRLVKSQRRRLKINQQQLARLCKVSVAAVRSWEQGRTLPRKENLISFVAVRKLGVKEARRRLGLPAVLRKKVRRPRKKK